MSSPFGSQGAVHGSSTRPGRGPLGLDGGHRELADLIRRSEVLAVGGDAERLHDAAQRVVRTLVRHIDEERQGFEKVETARRGRLLAGQEALLDCATRFATNPAPDAGADLLALLVRQADTEDAALHAGIEPTGKQPSNGDKFEFNTDWAIAPPLVGSP